MYIMVNFEEQTTQKLFDKNYISQDQFNLIMAYRSLNIFSIHTELKVLLYLSVLMFTTGIGILVYQNIESIGHIAILSFILLTAIVCFYFCFKNSDGFKREETAFKNPIFDYLVLTATILSCTFIGYLQYQYHTFGTHYGIATLIPTIIGFFCAYYFDNKSVLSIAITGLAAYVGVTVSPKSILNAEMYQTTTLSYSGIVLGTVLLLWTLYASRSNLKSHFNLIYLTFSINLICIGCITNLFELYWPIFAVMLALSVFYFYTISYKISSILLFVFAILYAYIGFNIIIFKVLEHIDPDYLRTPLIIVTPIYFIVSIVLFIKLIKNFNQK